jgi:hypothetical protein
MSDSEFISSRAASICCLQKLLKQSRLLPHGVVAAALDVSKQRLSNLILGGYVDTETVCGARLVSVSTALFYAKARWVHLNTVLN